MKIILNGEFLEENKAVIPINDKGYFFDFAVYSSVKVINGKVFFPEYHVCRLFESAKKIGLAHEFKEVGVISWLKKLADINEGNILYRILLIGNAEGDSSKAKLYIFAVGNLTFYPDKLYKRGTKVITYNGERRIPQSKSKDLLMSFLAYRQAVQTDSIDALLVDNKGNIREGTRSNFFAIKGEEIIVPPPGLVLEGITKKIICNVVNNNFRIQEENIPFRDIHQYEEFFISSTSINVMPIKQINDIVFNSSFEKTHLIQGLYKKFYDEEILKK
ncbi:MAG: aminotransferase class IV [Patescibacteria group bacterium]|jgi:branched-subunit amino acid aminotransferase/4-amino-4-deoxychorismate lyase